MKGRPKAASTPMKAASSPMKAMPKGKGPLAAIQAQREAWNSLKLAKEEDLKPAVGSTDASSHASEEEAKEKAKPLLLSRLEILKAKRQEVKDEPSDEPEAKVQKVLQA